MNECAALYDKLEWLHSPENPEYRENGIKIRFRFTGINEDPGQFEIVKSETSPLVGGDLVYKSETIYPYGTNLFYNPIPFEFLKTFEEKPQIIVNVGDQPAVCHNMTCDFTYTEPTGEITGVTYDKTTKKVVITGTNLPGKTAPVVSEDKCPTHGTETLCTADTTCSWANNACAKKSGRRLLNEDACNAHADNTACSAASTCLWDTTASKCNTDSCSAHSFDSVCKADSKCHWSGSACATDGCHKNSDATTCGAQSSCLWTGSECNTDICASLLDDTTCSANSACQWNN